MSAGSAEANTPTVGAGQAASGLLGGLTDWVERGFLIVVGLVIVAFGLWHLMGRQAT